VGLQGIHNLGRISQEQVAQADFNHLVEAIARLASGVSDGSVILTLESEGSVLVDGSYAWLELNGDNLRVEFLPLPSETHIRLTRGTYELSLVNENGAAFVHFRRI